MDSYRAACAGARTQEQREASRKAIVDGHADLAQASPVLGHIGGIEAWLSFREPDRLRP